MFVFNRREGELQSLKQQLAALLHTRGEVRLRTFVCVCVLPSAVRIVCVCVCVQILSLSFV